MKRYLLLLCATSALQGFYAQNSDDISTWASSHPEVYLMKAENYNSLSEDIKETIGNNVIVFNEKITIEKLESFDQTKSYASEDVRKGKDAQEIKDWLGLNQDVKIVKRSTYNAMSEEDKSYSAGALILIGETITVQDIRNY